MKKRIGKWFLAIVALSVANVASGQSQNPDSTLNATQQWPDTTVNELDEVVVVTKKPVIQVSGEKVTYNVEEDASSASSSVIEMLRKVPMVSVNGNDDIMLNGQKNFKIYVNGKEDPMMSANASAILKAMPASAIKRIEVMQQPGVKYDAEGTGGIINIVTIGKSVKGGYLTTVGVSASNKRISPDIYARTKIGNVTMSLNGTYSDNRIDDNAVDMHINRVYPSTGTVMTQDARTTMKSNFFNGAFQLSWDIDSLNLFTASASGYGAHGKNIFNTHTTSATEGGSGFSNSQALDTRWSWGSLTANAAWQHLFTTPGQTLVTSYQYVHGVNSNRMWQTYSDCENFTPSAPLTYNDNRNPTNEHTLQVDYTHPLSSKWSFETGLKGILRRNYGHSTTMTGSDAEHLIPNTDDAVNMDQYQNIAAIYASATATYGPWSTQAGARYEYTHMGVKFHTPGFDNFSTDLNDVVPNISATYTFSPANTLRINYQMRIRRPGISELNPHRTLVFTDFVQAGNPELSSEKMHVASITYTNFTHKAGGTVTISHDYSGNQISGFTYLDGATLISTYANAGRMNHTSLSGYLMWRPLNILSIGVNASVGYYDYNFKAAQMRNSGWSSLGGANITWSIPGIMDVNAYGGLSSRRPDLQGYQSGWDYHGLSLSRKFLAGKMKVAVSASNFLHPHATFSNSTHGTDYRSLIKVKVNTLSIGASVSYTFGSLRDDVKKAAHTIVNDDVRQSSSPSTTPQQ